MKQLLVTAALTIASLSGCVSLHLAEPVPTVADQRLLAGQRLLEMLSESRPRVEFSRGIPTFVMADVPTAQRLRDEPVAQALDYLTQLSDLYRLDDPVLDLYVERVATSELGTHVFFAQKYRDIPVFGSALGVHLQDGRVLVTIGRYLVPADLPTDAAIDGNAAESIALRSLPDAELVGDTQLVYFDPALFDEAPGPTRLGWRVGIVSPADDPVRRRRHSFVVDAEDGTILWTWRYGPTKSFGVYDETASFSNLWFNENGPTLRYPGGASAYPGGDADGDAAFVNLHLAYDYFVNRFGWVALDGVTDAPIRVVVHDDPGGGVGEYLDPGLILLGDGYADLPTIAHEYTHGVIAHSTQLAGSRHGSTLDEGYGNFFEVMNGGTWRIDQPLFAGPVHMDDFDETSGPRSDGDINVGIPVTAFKLLTEGGVGRPEDGIQVNGIGRTKAERLNFRVMTVLLNSNATLEHAYFVTWLATYLFATSSTSGFTLADVCEVRNAFAAVGLTGADRDCDGTVDQSQPDTDMDLIPNAIDNCPNDPNTSQEDRDHDNLGDVCDDSDADGVVDATDNCPVISNPGQADADGDRRGDACEDQDGDRVIDVDDNCRSIPNTNQRDNDTDGYGDACDNDDDDDFIDDGLDNCPLVANPDQADGDIDGVGNACDNCPLWPNPGRADLDGDGIGDACDADDDNDGVDDESDNCPRHPNPDQRNTDGDDDGFACDLNEQQGFYGGLTEVEYAEALLSYLERTGRFRVPIQPCDPRLCPGLPPEFAVTISLDLDRATTARVVDDRGAVVAMSEVSDAIELRFLVSPAAYYVPPQALLESEGSSLAFTGRRYYLEVDHPGGPDDAVTINAKVAIKGESLAGRGRD